MKEVLSQIGESYVIIKLFQLFFGNENISIYKNLKEEGYDILLINEKTNKKVKIEVKTRQKTVTAQSNINPRSAYFTLTEGEYKNADVLIGYWLERNEFYIVPVKDLTERKSSGKLIYRLELKIAKNNKPEKKYEEYLDNWDYLKKILIS